MNKRPTQKQTIIAALKRGERITSLSVLVDYGIARLAARIDEIKKEMDVKSDWIKVINRVGHTTEIKEYWIEEAQ